VDALEDGLEDVGLSRAWARDGPPGSLLLAGMHEYTLTNLRFAQFLFAGTDAAVERHSDWAAQRRAEEDPYKSNSTMPTTLQRERQCNVFLRACTEPEIITEVADALLAALPGKSEHRTDLGCVNSSTALRSLRMLAQRCDPAKLGSDKRLHAILALRALRDGYKEPES